MKLIVGLGNPGEKYAATRHNAGFWLVERLAAQSGTVLRKDGKFQALVGRHEASGAWLVMPQSFMNSSGRPVQMMASFFKIQPADVLIVHDELDLPPGIARLKQGGGVAGHNGLKDVSARLGTHDYWRLRLGVGRPAAKGAAIDYVLHRPTQDERAAIDEAIARALEVLPLVLAGDTQGAMLKLHTQEPEPSSPPPAKSARAIEPAQAPASEPPARNVAAEPDADKEKAQTAGQADKLSIAAAGAVEPRPEPARKPTSIERFGDAARAGSIGAAGSADRTERNGTIEKTGAAGNGEQAEKGERKSGLNSLLRKFLPGTGPARKK